MKTTTTNNATRRAMSAGLLGLSGLVTVGLLALPVTATASSQGDERLLKRDDDTPELVLVADDDDDDDTVGKLADTRSKATRSEATRTKNTRTKNTRSDRSRTGSRSGRDNSRSRKVKDWTTDGPGTKVRDWSANSTNDRSRNNTRGRG